MYMHVRQAYTVHVYDEQSKAMGIHMHTCTHTFLDLLCQFPLTLHLHVQNRDSHTHYVYMYMPLLVVALRWAVTVFVGVSDKPFHSLAPWSLGTRLGSSKDS